MLKSRYRLAALLIGLAIGVAVVMRYRQGEVGLPLLAPLEAGDTIDYSLHQFQLAQSGTDGAPREILAAVRLDHYRDRDESLLTRPEMTFAHPQQQWQLHAESGILYAQERLLLQQQVVLQSGGTSELPPLQLQTEQLMFDLRQQSASSDQPVTLESPQSQIRAGAMAFNLTDAQLRLFNRVHAIYHPNPR